MPVNVMAIHCNDRQVHDHWHCTSDIFIFRLLREFVQITKFCMSWRHFRNLFYEYCQREYPPPFQFRKLTDHSPLLLTLHRGARDLYIFIYKYYIYTHIIYVYNIYIYIIYTNWSRAPYVGLLTEERDQSRYMPVILLSELKRWGIFPMLSPSG